jgi:polyisoprenoid-binding protein YceI
MVGPGSYSFGPQNGRVLVKTYREGLAKAVGHDLVIEVGRWSANATVGEDPTDTTITATADVESVEPVEGVGGVKPLTDNDRREIKKSMRKILTAPEISFRSSSVKVAGSSATVTGDLTIQGRSETVDVQMTEAGGKIRGSFSVIQTRWGIKPYSGLLGALRLSDRVDIEFEVNGPTGD